jgi:hypothetical protein
MLKSHFSWEKTRAEYIITSMVRVRKKPKNQKKNNRKNRTEKKN